MFGASLLQVMKKEEILLPIEKLHISALILTLITVNIFDGASFYSRSVMY